MDLSDAISGRKSIRAFKKGPVSKEMIIKILEAATMAPSAINQQPWHFMVVTGDVRQRLGAAVLREYKEKGIIKGLEDGKLPEKYRRRTQQLFTEISAYLKEMGEDRAYVLEGSCQFYNAPVAIIATMDKKFYPSRLLDMGLAIQNLILTAHSLGLGTCPIGFVLRYDEAIRRELGISDEMEIVLAIALGHPDPDSPINKFKSSRDSVEQSLTWVGFEG